MADIDHEWRQRELTTITTDFQQRYPDLPDEAVEHTVRDAAADLVSHAHIANYLPVLIRRRVTRRLRAT